MPKTNKQPTFPSQNIYLSTSKGILYNDDTLKILKLFPPEMPEICIKAGCPEDGIVLDIFMGSGTTAYIAEKLNRRWIGIELNRDYCEITKERLLNLKNSFL